MLRILDALGNFVISLRDHHIDKCLEENLGFFKKISYNEKMAEIRESLLQSLCKHQILNYFLDLIREISDAEQ